MIRRTVQAFEDAFRDLLGINYVVSTSSGTAAYLAALLALDLPREGEVLLSGYTWPQLVAAPGALGLRTRFVDLDDSARMTAAGVEAAITSQTLVIVVSHLFGNPSEIAAIRQLADAHGLPVVEDCSQALLARQRGLPIGCWGQIGFASLGAGKMLSAREGGVAWTNDRMLYRRLFAVSQHPQNAPDRAMARECLVSSLSLRMHPAAAARALRDMRTLSGRVEAVSASHERLRALLSECAAIRLPEVFGDSAPAWTHFVFCARAKLSSEARELCSRWRPAYLVGDRTELPIAAWFDETARFIETGRSWEHVSDETIAEIARAIKASDEG